VGTQMKPLTLASMGAGETQALGRALGSLLHGGDVVLLSGSIGAGKSVLVHGIAAALGTGHWRGSPTFALIQEYATLPKLVHVDLYRLNTAEILDLGLEEYAREDTVMLVEWAERAPELLASFSTRSPVTIDIDITGEGERVISLSGPTEVVSALATEVGTA
jgi:tRNA threonylcarbamoyladenosine biosynthesis protein TsaE